MTTEKRLIFITSDERLVREISLKKSKNTHIIDLDTGKPIISTLSKHVRNKYIYKRTNNIISYCFSLSK